MKPTKAEIISIAVTALFIISAAIVLLSGKDASRCVTVTVPNAQSQPSDGAPVETAALKVDTGAEMLDINTAAKDELSSLPGIGEVLSEDIIAYREANGAFMCVEDIMAVSGIGEEKFKAIRDLIIVYNNISY